MFLRDKTINGYTYLYLVESVREGARTKQRIIKNLGRKDAVVASGELLHHSDDRVLRLDDRGARGGPPRGGHDGAVGGHDAAGDLRATDVDPECGVAGRHAMSICWTGGGGALS